MSTLKTQPTVGQLERTLAQRIQTLYRDCLNQWPQQITCHTFGQQLAIIVESGVSQPEKILTKNGSPALATEVRNTIDAALINRLKQLVTEILGVEALDILSDTTLSTERTGFLVMLSATPAVRNPEAIPKARIFQN